jgi:hypothetical protein
MQDFLQEIPLAVDDNKGATPARNLRKIMGDHDVLEKLRLAVPTACDNVRVFEPER